MNNFPAKMTRLLYGVIFSNVLLLTGCTEATSEDKSQLKTLPEVGVVTVKLQPYSIVTELPGRTVARAIAQIRPQVGGLIQKRIFTEGANVKAGDLLY